MHAGNCKPDRLLVHIFAVKVQSIEQLEYPVVSCMVVSVLLQPTIFVHAFMTVCECQLDL